MPMTPPQRARRVAAQTLADILPRLSRGLGPVDFAELERRVVREVEEAVGEAAAAPRLDTDTETPMLFT